MHVVGILVGVIVFVSLEVNGQCPPETCPLLASGITEKDKKEIVELHNKLRQKIANGEVDGYPTASNMTELTWDHELYEQAQTWATGCMYKHSNNTICRKNDKWSWVGENTAVEKSSNERITPNWKKFITKWFDEYKNYPPSEIDSFNPDCCPGKKKGHFTQVIWADTTRVGCGFTAYANTGRDPRVAAKWPYVQLYVCNYGPGGNNPQEPIYYQGDPCSGCANSQCGEYQGLCAPIND